MPENSCMASFSKTKDYDGAIATIEGYLRLNDKDIFNLVTLGEVYALKGDDARARSTFQKIITLEPKNPQGYFQMARLALKTKKMDEVLKYANKALQEQAGLPARLATRGGHLPGAEAA